MRQNLNGMSSLKGYNKFYFLPTGWFSQENSEMWDAHMKKVKYILQHVFQSNKLINIGIGSTLV